MREIITQCRAGNRCKQWRVCEQCAKIRQARIANVAEQGSLKSPYITYAVVRPIEGNNFPEEKQKIVKAISGVADGGIWTVETGKFTGLHTNLVIGSSERFDPQIIYKTIGVESHVWTNTNVDHKDVRNISSYASKQEGMPKKGEYRGNYYGSFGSWKQPLAVAATQRINPELALMTIEQLLIDRSVPLPEIESIGKEEAQAMGMNMIERINYNKKKAHKARLKALEIENDNAVFKHTQRSLAVLADEIELKGLALHPQLGIVGKRELREYGIKCVT